MSTEPLSRKKPLSCSSRTTSFFSGFVRYLKGLPMRRLDLRERVSDDFVDVLREGLAHRLGEARARLFGGLGARAAHLDAQQPFDELLRRHRFFEVVVDAEEADNLVVFVADEDAAAFDELAAVVLRKVVEYAPRGSDIPQTGSMSRPEIASWGPPSLRPVT